MSEKTEVDGLQNTRELLVKALGDAIHSYYCSRVTNEKHKHQEHMANMEKRLGDAADLIMGPPVVSPANPETDPVTMAEAAKPGFPPIKPTRGKKRT